MRIALAGNPNSGKTTMYNALTGANEKVGNWAGVTVDKKEHNIKDKFLGDSKELVVVDLPGAYSMSPFTSEESITSDYITKERPDVIINIVDATNLSRSLFFTTQLLEIGIPVVVALNKTDANEKKHNKIDKSGLSELLGCAVVETASISKRGLSELISACAEAVGKEQKAPYSDSRASTDKRSAMLADRKRYSFVNSVVAKVEVRETLTGSVTKQDKVDDILTNKWFGIPIFAAVMFVVFMFSQWEYGPGVLLADLLAGWLEAGQEAIAAAINSDSIWASILIDGIIGGFIAIVGFLPLVMVMYFLIALLEDLGYMARATVVLDPIFKRVGLSGKAVIPFIIGTGCAIPGVMASRTIRDERERRTAAMLAPFMPCGAKLPVIALFAGVFFGDSPWVGALVYFIAIIVILLAALLVSAISGAKLKKSYFIMELPEYKAPSLLKALRTMLERGWAFIVKAGTVILVCNFAVHLMQNFTWSFTVAENPDSSILSAIATPFAYIFAPIVGFVSWQLAAAAITGFIAKENVVATLAVCFGITNLINPDELAIEGGAEISEIAAIFGTGSGGAMIAAVALAYLAFNLFSPPCFAAIGAMNAEIKSKKWFFAGIGLQFSVGYTVGFLINFFGSLLSGGLRGETWTYIVGWAVTVTLAVMYTLIIVRNKIKARASKLQKADKIPAEV